MERDKCFKTEQTQKFKTMTEKEPLITPLKIDSSEAGKPISSWKLPAAELRQLI